MLLRGIGNWFLYSSGLKARVAEAIEWDLVYLEGEVGMGALFVCIFGGFRESLKVLVYRV